MPRPTLPTAEELRAALATVEAYPIVIWLRRHWLLIGAATALMIAGVTLSYAFTCGYRTCPSAADIQAYAPREGSSVLDREGELLGRLQYVRRVNVPLDSVPERVRDAFLAVEDQRFYEHGGVDWRSVGRAAFRNVRELGVSEGFSTITMQLVRNAFIPDLAQERSLRRKLIEVVLAHRLEKSLSKDQILELYLNVIYLGNGAYGVEAASRDLFDKNVQQLSLAEAATLAALPKGPSAYNPRMHPERARKRRDLVLSLMASQQRIPADSASLAAAEPFVVKEKGWFPHSDDIDALDLVRAFVDSVLGGEADKYGDVVVRTTLDARAQSAAQRAVRSQAARIERTAESAKRRDAEVEGAMVAMDPRTGEIRALVNGSAYERGGFGRALRAHRQPGSAFKPFVYGAALKAGHSPAEVLDDSPVEIHLASGDVWRPTNFGGEHMGRATMRRALMRSANAATVRLAQAVTIPRVIEYAHLLGIESDLPDVPSLALGSAEVTPIELVTAYSAFANGGYRVRPRLVLSIERTGGDTLWRADSATPERVIDAREAYQVTSMLQTVVDRGTGFEVRRLGVQDRIAGKTGTTNDGNDVWFVGYSPSIVAAVWFGYDNPEPLGWGASGGRLAAPAWVDFFKRGWRTTTRADWEAPSGMVMRTIDAFNGELANEYCPVTQPEWFKSGSEPTTYCDEHQASFWDRLGDAGGAIGGAIKKILGI